MAKDYNREKKPREGSKPDSIMRAYNFEKKESTSDEDTGLIFGRNAVMELLKSGRDIDKLYIARGNREGSITVIASEAIGRGIPVIDVDRAKLDRLSQGMNHQGVAASASAHDYVSIKDILAIASERGEAPLIIIADGIEDPYNLGAVIRCAEGAGAHGVIIPKRRSAGLGASAAKSSAGAVEHMAVARVSNLATAIEELKTLGVWIYGAEAGGAEYYNTDLKGSAAIVLGSEGKGISRLIKEKCDFIISIPMYGKVNSFNVSTAAAVLLCEAARQRRANRTLTSKI